MSASSAEYTYVQGGEKTVATQEPHVAGEPAAQPYISSMAITKPIKIPISPSGVDLRRARWVEGRLQELPKLVAFLYNALLDSRIMPDLREHAFGTLRYIFEEDDIIQDQDPVLGRLDDLAMAYRCFGELIGRLPQATLSIYEEVLIRDGIPVRSHTAEAAVQLGKFYEHVAILYQAKIDSLRKLLGNAIKTGELIQEVQAYLQTASTAPWPIDRLEKVEQFLSAYNAK